MNEDFNYGGPSHIRTKDAFPEINIFRSCGEGYDDIIMENPEVFMVVSTSQEIILLSSRLTTYAMA